MTVLNNSIKIDATPERVWSVLSDLDALQEYDPVVSQSKVVSSSDQGVGAARQCHLAEGGWFKERVTEWNPAHGLAFELFECTLPVKTLTYRYVLTPDARGTVVTQHMEYRLKFGPLGRLMDLLMVRRKWDAGVKGFFAGLKQHVETGGRARTGEGLSPASARPA